MGEREAVTGDGAPRALQQLQLCDKHPNFHRLLCTSQRLSAPSRPFFIPVAVGSVGISLPSYSQRGLAWRKICDGERAMAELGGLGEDKAGAGA